MILSSIVLSQTKSAEAEISKKEWSGHVEWSDVGSNTDQKTGTAHSSVQDGGKAQFSFTILDNGALSGYGTGSEQINEYSEVCYLVDSNHDNACAGKWHNRKEGSTNFNFTVGGVSYESCPDQKFKSCVSIDLNSPTRYTVTNTGDMPGVSGRVLLESPHTIGEYASFIMLGDYNHRPLLEDVTSLPNLLELKDGASLHYQSDDGAESINLELNGPSNECPKSKETIKDSMNKLLPDKIKSMETKGIKDRMTHKIIPKNQLKQYEKDGWQLEKASGKNIMISKEGHAIDRIIIHDSESGEGTTFPGLVKYLKDNDRGVSAHYVIGQNDGEIANLVPDNMKVIHTQNYNDRSIGIELLYITGSNNQYTDWQYDALASLVNQIAQANNIPIDKEHVIGHGDVWALKKGEPHNFDWSKFWGKVKC